MLWLGISLSKFYDWRKRYGKVNEHNAAIPRDHWLSDEEKQAILAYEREYPLEGYRRRTFMMLDDDVAAASPASVYRVLKAADRLHRPSPSNQRKGKGFHQPDRPHRHGHIDFSHLNICGTFYHICSVLDGYSRYVVHWEIRPTMFESDAEIVVQRAREKFPGEHPRIISDNGPQFVAKDFKQFVRLCGMTHVTPADKLLGLEPVIHAQRDQKLEAARERRHEMRQAAQESRDASPPVETSACVTPSERPPRDLAALRRQVSIGQVLEHLGYLDLLRGFGPQRRGPCPLHDPPSEPHRSFSVHLTKGVFRCFHPACQAQGNTLDLWAAYHRLPLGQAAENLAQTFAAHLTSPEKSVPEKRNP